MFVDEKLINELVKDIQRALLQSDTNVQLVFSLSKAALITINGSFDLVEFL